jgi:tetratricopeptide (TPR) repeat protein
MHEAIPCAICALIIGFFVWATDPNTPLEATGSAAKTSYYNLLVQGFSEGHLYVKREAPAGLARLANPYDPAANAPYRGSVNDLSYYKGRLYLYFGITPALLLFWPYHVLTGHYLSEGSAVAIFFAIGFAAALALVRAMCRRYFTEAKTWMITGYMLGLGLALGLTLSGSIYEIAITCGFAFAILALLGIWHALHARPGQKVFWLLFASLAYGLAVGSRPSLLFGAIVLLVPVVQSWRETFGRESRWRVISLLAAAVGPIMFIGFGLMLYNDLRFGDPFEFGWHYQLLGDYCPITVREFSAHYLWFNLYLYFSRPFGWSDHFPFLQSVPLPPLPSGYVPPAISAGILINYPLILLIAAVPLAWKRGPMASGSGWFVAAIFLLFLGCAFPLWLNCAACDRYKMDLLPGLLLLSVIGLLVLERVTSPVRPWGSFVRWAWRLLLAYTLIFNILLNVEAHAEVHYLEGNSNFHDNRFDEAISQYQEAEALWPDCADAHYGLGNTLVRKGYLKDAIAEYQQALDIEPDSPEANNNLAFALLQAGQVDDAIKYFQRASELQNSYQAFYNLAYALRMDKMPLEAETNWQRAIELQPQFMPAEIDLSWTLATWPDAGARNGARALALAEKLDLSSPNDPKILRTLAAAYAETGDFPGAVATAKRALTLAQAQAQTTLARELQAEIALYQKNAPCRSFNN